LLRLTADFCLNVFAPLFLGALIYIYKNELPNLAFFKNFLADALWAYAFFNSLLIIWLRKKNRFWIAAGFITAVCFEVFQFYQLLPGTPDFFDVVVYFISFIFSLLCNKFFKKIFLYDKY
jgi:hypothetical protein